jgi:hypothetical protein
MAIVYKNIVVQTTGSLATAYTAPSATTSIVLGYHIANNDTTANYAFTSTITDSSASVTRYLARGFIVPLNTAISILDGKLILETGDYIQIQSDTTAKIDVVLSIAEVS